MSRERQAQWTCPLDCPHTLRERFTTTHRYEQAYEAYLVTQHVHDRWADDMFRSPH